MFAQTRGYLLDKKTNSKTSIYYKERPCFRKNEFPTASTSPTRGFQTYRYLAESTELKQSHVFYLLGYNQQTPNNRKRNHHLMNTEGLLLLCRVDTRNTSSQNIPNLPTRAGKSCPAVRMSWNRFIRPTDRSADTQPIKT